MSSLKLKHMGILFGRIFNRKCVYIASTAIGFILSAAPLYADNTVKLKVLVIATGNEMQDQGLAYIKPVLDEMGVPYDLLNADSQDLTAEMLSSSSKGNGCLAEQVGCIGNYNGVILTNSDLVANFSPQEWDVLHNYEKNFRVREAVLSGWPATYQDPNPPFGTYLDYGLAYSASPAIPFNAIWTVPQENSNEIYEYVNKTNSLPVTGFAFSAVPRNDANGPRDGTVPNVIPLLTTQGNEVLVSIVQYKIQNQALPVREVLISTISNASYLLHSQVLAYEFINWATQGVFVGARFVHMAAQLDDMFLPNALWDVTTRSTSSALTYRLNSKDISNAVKMQSAFRALHPTAGDAFKLDFPFNGAGAVKNQQATNLVVNSQDDLVKAVIANKNKFRFINHTFTHANMDIAPIPANAPCDYTTLSTVSEIEAEITLNRTVWGLLGLPEQSNNNRVMVSGNHSGLNDRKCTSAQADDIPFPTGTNPLFLQAAAKVGVEYIASDASQINQAVEQYISSVDDGNQTDRIILPRWPTGIFFNTIIPDQLVDEYNYIFHDQYINAGLDPCTIPGAICATRNYDEILAAESFIALQHMLSYKKWPHYFHQSNIAKYNKAGNTLQFDWLNSVFTEYEALFSLPVKNMPYYMIGDKTKDRLIAKSADIKATWDRTANRVSLTASKSVPNLLVTGLEGGELYGGQFIQTVSLDSTTKSYIVNQAQPPVYQPVTTVYQPVAPNYMAEITKTKLRMDEERIVKKQITSNTKLENELARQYRKTAERIVSLGGDPKPLLDAAIRFEDGSN